MVCTYAALFLPYRHSEFFTLLLIHPFTHTNDGTVKLCCDTKGTLVFSVLLKNTLTYEAAARSQSTDLLIGGPLLYLLATATPSLGLVLEQLWN